MESSMAGLPQSKIDELSARSWQSAAASKRPSSRRFGILPVSFPGASPRVSDWIS